MTPYFEGPDVTIWNADSRDAWRRLPEQSVDAIVTSPPYFGLRDYGVDGQLGLEDDPAEFITQLADLLTGYGERVMKPGGSLWLNLGDSYHDKSLLMIPEQVAIAMRDRGWLLRNKVVWAKPNGMPDSVKDRLTTKHEPMFHFVRDALYFYDLDAIREPHTRIAKGPKDAQWVESTSWNRNRLGEVGSHPNGANPGDVWSIATQPYPDAHFAVFPPELVRRPILATVPEGGIVLDPFFGSGTTAVMARRLGRKAWGVELNPDYCRLAASRFQQDVLPLDGEVA